MLWFFLGQQLAGDISFAVIGYRLTISRAWLCWHKKKMNQPIQKKNIWCLNLPKIWAFYFWRITKYNFHDLWKTLSLNCLRRTFLLLIFLLKMLFCFRYFSSVIIQWSFGGQCVFQMAGVTFRTLPSSSPMVLSASEGASSHRNRESEVSQLNSPFSHSRLILLAASLIARVLRKPPVA